MKVLKYIFLGIMAICLFATCDDFEFMNLKRDNPLDQHHNANTQNGVALMFDSYYVYSDNNNDKIVNKGETVKLNVSLKNSGSLTANGVKATFSTTSSYVSGFSPTSQIYYGNISAGSAGWKGYSQYNDHAIQFTVSNTIPNNTQIPISISIVDENGNTWSESFNVIVEGIGANITYGSYYVYSDNNNDKIVNKGETVKLNVSLENIGSSTANRVNATFSTTSSYVSGFSPTSQVYYGNISAGSTIWKGYSQYNDYAIQFTVSNTTPNNTQIPISISIVDENGNTWTKSFNIVVVGTSANITYGSYYVYSDNNNDKIVNKGETVKLNVSLENIGSSTANGVNATFSTTSSYVSGFSPTSQVYYGNISAGSTIWKGYSQYNDYAIQFTVSNTTPNNTQIPISISIVDESGNTWTKSFNIVVVGTSANITYGSYYVYSDNNNDKIVNKGETVKLNVSLNNIGSSTANGVYATFSTTSSYVSGFSPTSQVYYGNISAGSTIWKGYSQYNDYAIQFTVSSTTPNNTQIPISISIVDENNNTWLRSFYITVYQ